MKMPSNVPGLIRDDEEIGIERLEKQISSDSVPLGPLERALAAGKQLLQGSLWVEEGGRDHAGMLALEARNQLLSIPPELIQDSDRTALLKFQRVARRLTSRSMNRGWSPEGIETALAEFQADVENAINRQDPKPEAARQRQPASWPTLPKEWERDLPRSQWRFLQFMWGKSQASFDQIKEDQGNENMKDKSIQALVSKVNSDLLKKKVSVSFTTKTPTVFAEIRSS